MPTTLDFGSSKSFRDFLINKTLTQPNGPQTFTSEDYVLLKTSDMANADPGTVDANRNQDLLQTSTSNVFKPEEYFITENLETIPRKANLSLYPYFNWDQSYNLVGIMANPVYETESELMKFAMMNIKENKQGPVWGRFSQNLYTTTSGKVRLLDALEGNTTTAINLITGREPLIEMNSKITVAKTATGKEVDFLQTVAGIEFPWSEIPGDYLSNPKNPINNARPDTTTEAGKLWQDVTGALGQMIGIQRRSSTTRKPSDLFIEYMGARQKTFLNDALTYSKYGPDYTTEAMSQNTSKVFNFVNQFGKGVKTVFGLESPKKSAYIGDDRGNDVKYAMNDFNDRLVRSSYYLGIMFDPIQTRLFERQKNIVDGGGIAGKLTWISTKSRNKLGANNAEYQSEGSQFSETLSTSYAFREDSILGKTQEILETMPTDGGTLRSHVANVIDQTSRIFKDGDIMMSKGSAIKYVDQYTNAESGVEYCRVWTKDRSYMNYSDTMKRTGNVRKFESSVMSMPWNLNIYPNSNGNGAFDSGSTNIVQGKNGFYAKKYMFSIENLAWKTSNTPGFTYNDLPYCERGSNGGRVMWFPPYDLKISEQNSANWESNKFLGRPEPVYTYNNAERSGSISFRVIVDHPSILNLLVREYFKGMSDEEADNYINAFFAGCEEIDFYGLIRKYTTLTPDDVKAIQNYLNQGKDPNTIIRYTKLIDPVVETYTPKNQPTTTSISTQLYFKNDYPKITTPNELYSGSQENYAKLYTEYLNSKGTYITDLNYGLSIVTGGTWNSEKANDYFCLTRETSTTKPSDEKLASMIDNANSQINQYFNTLTNNYTTFSSDLSTLKSLLTSNEISDIKVSIGSRTSSIADDHYNLDLSYRRSHSILVDILNKISNGTVPSTENIWKQDPKATDYKLDEVKPMEIDLSELGYDNAKGKFTVEYVVNSGEQDIVVNGENNSDCSNKYLIKTSSELKMTAPNTFGCRQGVVKIDYTTIPKDEVQSKPPEPTRVPVEIVVDPNRPNYTPPIDEMKKIIMKTLSECYYFKKLEEDSPQQFSSLKEKLRYFHPAFHSMTPEGLNARLTFLHQCLRPGDTIPIKGTADYSDINARNTTFGPPPICILRIGDFYHSKIVIKDVQIDFEDSIWDLNPEGIGVQPMFAKVNLQVYFIGGHGLEKPVERLQNALSSNFYANTEMYDPRATATEDRSKFTKEFLEELIKSKDNKENTNTTSQDKSNTNIQQGEFIGEPAGRGLVAMGGSTAPQNMPKTLNYSSLIESIYTNNTAYFTTLYGNDSKVYDKIVKTYGSKIASMIMSPVYRNNKDYVIETGTGTETIELFGEYPKGAELEVLSSDFKSQILSKIETENISTIMGLNKELSPQLLTKSEDILKPWISKTIGQIIDGITQSSFNTVIEIRNKMIKDFDKLNFMTNVGHDGFISGDIYSGATLISYTADNLYNEYSNLVMFIKEYHKEFTEDLDTSYTFSKSTTMTTENLSEFLSVLLKKARKEDILDIYRKNKFPEWLLIPIGNRLDIFLADEPEDKDFSNVISNLPIRKYTKSLTFTVQNYNYSFTDNEKNMLEKVNNLGSYKPTTNLNYYR